MKKLITLLKKLIVNLVVIGILIFFYITMSAYIFISDHIKTKNDDEPNIELLDFYKYQRELKEEEKKNVFTEDMWKLKEKYLYTDE